MPGIGHPHVDELAIHIFNQQGDEIMINQVSSYDETAATIIEVTRVRPQLPTRTKV